MRAVAVIVCVPAALLADTVTVRSGEDGLSLTGRMVGYDGTFLQLETDYGLMTLDYAGVTCAGDACPDRDAFVPQIRLSGARRLGEVLMPALIEAYGRSIGTTAIIEAEDDTHLTVTLTRDDGAPHAVFRFRLTNTDEGFADLIALEADLVMAVREIREAEAQRAESVGLGDIRAPRQARILGFDALVPIVHPGLDVGALSLLDIARAFRGEVTSWQALGGQDLPISLHLGLETDGSWQFFTDHVIRRSGAEPSAGILRHEDATDVARAVADTTGALGIVPFGENGPGRAVALRDACGFVATARAVTLKTQDYPLTQPLFLYVPDRLQPDIVGDFLAWIRGPEAQLVVRRAGFIDQGAVPIPLDAQGQRFVNAIAQAGDRITLAELQRMVEVLAQLTRLSTSFRFEEDKGQLDATSRSNLLALGQAIRDGRYRGRRLLLVGFGDGTDDQEADVAGSRARAEAVRGALIAALGELPADVTVDVAAFGEALPMGCDDTPWGRQRNRRVELWVDQG